MKMNDMFPSQYLKAGDIGDDKPVYTIHSVEMKEIGIEEKETKPVLSFEETEKDLVLNKTNASTIASLYGDDSEKWKGQKIRLIITEVAFRGKMAPAIRVSSIKP